jgi:uncharacterized protein YcbK (DUF882 family)
MSWENFTLEEFACKHCGKNEISHDLIDKLQELREECEFPFIITSGYRCSEHPAEINKDKPGMHAKGLAVDILVSGSQAYEVVSAAPSFGFTGIGVNQKGKDRFIHLDINGDKNGKIRPYIWSY